MHVVNMDIVGDDDRKSRSGTLPALGSNRGAHRYARIEQGDVEENEAAFAIAKAAAGADIRTADPFTGRANLHATARGLLVFDRPRLDRLNLIDEAVTLGTLPEYAIVEPRQMVATIKEDR